MFVFPFHRTHSLTFTMSRSHSYSNEPGHSRGSRRRGSSTLAVTEASFQGLQLNETAGTQHTPSYTASNPTYPRSSSHRGELTASYLQPGYDIGDFTPAPPSETFVDPQRVFGDYRPSDAQRLGFLDPETAGLGIQQASAGSSVFPRRDMRYIYRTFSEQESYLISFEVPTLTLTIRLQANITRKARTASPGLRPCRVSFLHLSPYGFLIEILDSPYSGGEPQRRSMSGPTGSLTLPSSAFSGLSTQEHVIARQRRRGLQEPRRQAKVRSRRAILPSTSDAGSSRAHTVSHSTDFLAAPSSTSSYDVNTSSGSHPYGGRTSSASSTRGQYVSWYDCQNLEVVISIDLIQFTKSI